MICELLNYLVFTLYINEKEVFMLIRLPKKINLLDGLCRIILSNSLERKI